MAPNRKTTISIPVSSALPSPTYSPPSPSPSSLSPPRSTAKLQLEPLLPVQMCKVLDAILASVNAPTVEAAILYMMHRYSFDFEVLKKCLEARSLDVSFSRIQFQHIAPLVGLAPEFELRDVGLFEVNRARITDELFAKIHDDMCVAVNNYGPPMDHENEEARSRFIAPLFTRTVAEFQLLIKNTPGSIIEGRLTKKGRIEYLFRAFGGIAMLFIEVKYRLASSKEYLDAVAQVIAEADACDYINQQNNLSTPVYGILCDGRRFQFFSFTRDASPQVSMGYFPFLHKGPRPAQELEIVALATNTPRRFMLSVRTVCEAIFHVLLRGYTQALQAYYDRSVAHAAATGEATPMWFASIEYARAALTGAVRAAAVHADGAYDEAGVLAHEASAALQKSVAEAPPMLRREDAQEYRVGMDMASFREV